MPVVSMLWEDADPDEVLRRRFGLAGGEAAAAWVAGVLHRCYGITLVRCERVVMSDRNALAWTVTDRGALVVKWCVAPERFERLAQLAALTGWLDEQGELVSAPLQALDGRRQVEIDGVSVGVQHVVDGDLLDCSDDRLVHEAGRVLARLHVRLAQCPSDRVPSVIAPRTQPLRDQVMGWLDDAPAHVPGGAVDRLRAVTQRASTEPLPVQVVHGDYRSANVLCGEGRVRAVLDFEESRTDHAVAELARSAVLLGTQFRGWGPVSRHTREIFRSGYESVRPLTADEASWWEPLVLWWSLLFVPDGDDPTGWARAALAEAGHPAR